jgi:hypothetical protein
MATSDGRPVIWVIARPGNRAGAELWAGPVGLSLTWPPRWPLAWNWGWWQHLHPVRP